MRMTDMDVQALRRAVQEERKRTFNTYDISDSESMCQAHADLVHERSYRPLVGKWLRRLEPELGIRWQRSGTKGAQWLSV